MTNRLKMAVAVLIASLLAANPAGPFASAQTPAKDSPADVVIEIREGDEGCRPQSAEGSPAEGCRRADSERSGHDRKDG